MSELTQASPGEQIATRLHRAIANLKAAGRNTTRRIIRGITPSGQFVGGIEEPLVQIRKALVSSGVVYRRGADLVMETNGPDGKSLKILAEGNVPGPGAEAMLVPVIACERVGSDQEDRTEFLLPAPVIRLLANDDQLRCELPAIERYALRPVLSVKYRLLGPGYHPGEKALVHGPLIEPYLDFHPHLGGRLLERLPPHLRYLFQHLPFESEADLADALGILLTGIMPEHFSACGRPMAVIDGNQPGLGKSSFINEVGLISDGALPPQMTFSTNDEELEKGIASVFRDQDCSVILIDNVRTASNRPIQSPVMERFLTAERIQSRILGQTHLLDRPNDRLWALTCNGGQLGKDILSRSVIVRLRFRGDPDSRIVPENMIAWTRKHRLELLAELFGLVQKWVDAGCPRSNATHRFRDWAAIIGGILDANGLGEHFLVNQAEIAEEFDATAAEFEALAETVLESKSGPRDAESARPASGWSDLFLWAGIPIDGLTNTAPSRSITTQIGRWLTAREDQSVTVSTTEGGEVRMTLRAVPGRGKTKKYFFELADTRGSENETDAPEIGDTAPVSELSGEHLDPGAPMPPAPGSAAGNALVW